MSDDLTYLICAGCGAPLLNFGTRGFECQYCGRRSYAPSQENLRKLMDEAVRRIDQMTEEVYKISLDVDTLVPGDTVDLKVVTRKGDLQKSVSLLTEDEEWDRSTYEWLEGEEAPTTSASWVVFGCALILVGLLVPSLWVAIIPGLVCVFIYTTSI